MIEELSWNRITKLVLNAKNSLRLVLPALYEEWTMLIQERMSRGALDLKVCINNSEKYIRDGFGDEKAVAKLKSLSIEVVETNNNRISLISVDDIHYMYFPTSRTFESLLDEDITNAVRIDGVLATQLLFSFFSSDIPALQEHRKKVVLQALNRSVDMLKAASEILEEGKIEPTSKEFDEKKFTEIQKNIEANPVQSPDLKREIEVYTTKVQFVELKFENGKINSRRVKIPERALPFQNEQLKKILESSMRVFTKGDDEIGKLAGYQQIQKDVADLRKAFLKTIKCRNDKSLLEQDRKSDFLAEVAKINGLIETEKEKVIAEIDKEIEDAQQRLHDELLAFFKANPPKEYTKTPDTLPQKVERMVTKLVYGEIPFPTAAKMVEGMCLKHRFYDLTYDDFSDEELVTEFEKKGIMNGDLKAIRDLRKAYEVKK
jgi:hypothetical protein